MGLSSLCKLKGCSVFVFGMGGGGDVIGATLVARMLERAGASKCYVGAVVWERYVVDIVPGPISVEQIENCERLGSCAAVVDGDEYAVREGAKIVFQAARLARALGEKVYIIDISKGAEGVARGIEELRSHLGIDAVVAVDVGGDVLAVGGEEDLWSPLADSVSLAGMLKSSVDVKVLAVLGLSSDGELDQQYLLGRIAFLAKHGGLIEARGLSKEEAELLEKLLKSGLVSETSLVILKAFNGVFEDVRIRDGSRVVPVSPVMTIAWLIDASKVDHLFPLAQTVADTKSIEEANTLLNKRKIATELNLEREVYKVVKSGGRVDSRKLIEIWTQLRKALENTR